MYNISLAHHIIVCSGRQSWGHDLSLKPMPGTCKPKHRLYSPGHQELDCACPSIRGAISLNRSLKCIIERDMEGNNYLYLFTTPWMRELEGGEARQIVQSHACRQLTKMRWKRIEWYRTWQTLREHTSILPGNVEVGRWERSFEISSFKC